MNRVRIAIAIAAVTATVLPATAATAAPAAAKATLADKLVKAVTVDGVNRHLIAFQRIADRNGGQRAEPTQGAKDSMAYVESKVRAAGFDVSIHEFTYERIAIDAADLTVGTVKRVPTPMAGVPDTPVGGITAPLVVVPVDATPGCQAEDYAGLNATGAIVLIKRGGCTFTQKQVVAANAGAAAAVVYNIGAGAAQGAVDPALARIPMVMVREADGIVLSGLGGTSTKLDVRRHMETTPSRNLIAQTKTGRKDNVVTVGSHVDGDGMSPAINDNASGVSVLLELALQLGNSPKVNNGVRFAWWGADWGNSGSAAYLNSLDFERKLDIALYVDIPAVGSSNGGHFVYDGDNSAGQVGPMPYGSAQIEQTFANYLTGVGVQTEAAPFVGQGDYAEFMAEGIPTGGIFSGIPHMKTAEQAAKWGGTAGIALDPCNHSACDTLGNINRPILDRNADVIAFATGTYATSTEDVNGVPPRAKRAAARVANKTMAATTAGATQ